MANSLPVIATTVGSIPHFLTHKKNVFLIEPKQTNQLVQAIECLLTDATLRQQMIEGGQQMAKETTLEYQTEKLLDAIKLNLY
jgi:glycosyltransferase involved in cell wall biosynthesis